MVAQNGNVPSETPDVQTANLRLVNLLTQVDDWIKESNIRPDEPEQGSSMSGDDKHLAGFQMSHSVHAVLASAVDHLHAFKSLVGDAGVLHRCVPTLFRAALENASVAVWLLSPAARKARVLRRLRWQWADFKDDNKMRSHMGTGTRDFLNGKRERLKEVAQQAGLNDPEIERIWPRLTFSEIVEEAGRSSRNLTEGITCAVWMACSGVTHARTWATLSVNQHDEITRTAENIMQVRLSANDSLVESFAVVAALMTHEGRMLLRERSVNYLG